MKRILTALVILTAVTCTSLPALAGAWPQPPASLVVTASSLGTVDGYTDAGQLVELTISAPDGTVKAIGRTVAGVGGNFSLGSSLGPFGGMLSPGDTLTFVLADNPAYTYAVVYPNLAVTGFDLARGTISGRVVPPPTGLFFSIQGSRLIPDAVTVAASTDVEWNNLPPYLPPGRDGRFSFKPLLTGTGWTGTFRRNDRYSVQANFPIVPGNDDFMLAAVEEGPVTGLIAAQIGTAFAVLYGPNLRSYAAKLLSPAGKLKGSSAASLSSSMPIGFLDFRKADRRPGIIATGDKLKVSGVGGFTATVPRLKATIDTLANTVTILAKPDSFVEVGFSLYDAQGTSLPSPPDVWVLTDASGVAVLSPGVTLHERDRVDLGYTDAAGNRWFTVNQALP